MKRRKFIIVESPEIENYVNIEGFDHNAYPVVSHHGEFGPNAHFVDVDWIKDRNKVISGNPSKMLYSRNMKQFKVGNFTLVRTSSGFNIYEEYSTEPSGYISVECVEKNIDNIDVMYNILFNIVHLSVNL